VLIENVKGLVFNGKDEGLQLLESELRAINRRHGVDYQTSIIHLNCANFGVPQLRERVFIVAEREGRQLSLPSPTHLPDGAGKPGADRHRTAWDALGDLDGDEWPDDLAPRGKWANLLPSIPEGENYLWHTPRSGGDRLFGWRRRFWSFLLKLAKDRPSWTIQAGPGPATGPFHWRSRRLSTRELCRLQTFPDSFEVVGEYRSRQRQIGNAVPPAIGELLGREIRRQLLGERPHYRTSFVPPARSDCPEPEPVLPVPREYWHLRGDHDDHPGTGEGPGAQERAAAEAAQEVQG
jgi:DNA (cytosine-5)-methyltransferase 1